MGMQPTEDERVLAALSHASIVANVVNLAGMIATALIWTMQRDRSPYVRAHALQALVYQGAVLLIAIFLALFGGMCLTLSLLPVMLRPDLYRGSPPTYSIWLGIFSLLALIGFGVAATIYGLFGAYQVYRGRPFRYLVIGRLALPVPVVAPDITPAPEAAPAQPVEPGPAPAAAQPLDEPPAGAAPSPPKRPSRRTPPDKDA
jgi:uncharacterized Tic20 family protein